MKTTIRTAFAILSLASGLLTGCDVDPDEATAPDSTTAVTEALTSTGGAGSLSWYCSDDGSCTCSGGTLSSDCCGPLAVLHRQLPVSRLCAVPLLLPLEARAAKPWRQGDDRDSR